MDRVLARNIVILLVLAALVAFAPGAGLTKAVADSLVNAAFLTVLVFAAALFYRSRQHDLWALGDRHRGLLYGALGLFVVLMAGRAQLAESGAGTALLFAGFVAVGGAGWAVVQRVRAYR